MSKRGRANHCGKGSTARLTLVSFYRALPKTLSCLPNLLWTFQDTKALKIPLLVVAGIRVCDRGVFQSQDQAGDLRFGGVPLHCREHASGSRHAGVFRQTIPSGVGRFVCASVVAGAVDEVGSAGTDCPGREQVQGECMEAQSAVSWPSREDRDAVAGEWKLVTLAFNLKRMHALSYG